MDELKAGEIRKSPQAGHKSSLMCTSQKKRQEIKVEINGQTVRISRYKKKNIHENKRINESQ
jgi:hypothetical protein